MGDLKQSETNKASAIPTWCRYGANLQSRAHLVQVRQSFGEAGFQGGLGMAKDEHAATQKKLPSKDRG